jgi:DNA sulfur modification protein DndD
MHRENVLKYIPSIAEQVVLLVHEGEIALESDLEVVAKHVGAVYEIKRLSSEESTLERVRT